jgi:hypothetical protein
MANTERPRRRPAIKRSPKPRAAKSAAQSRPRDPNPELWTPPEYDHIVDYRESLTSDFGAVAADHPGSAALGAFLLGIAVGLLLAWIAHRSDG